MTALNEQTDEAAGPGWEHPDPTALQVAHTFVMALHDAGVRFRLEAAGKSEDGELIHGHMVIEVPHPNEPGIFVDYEFPNQFCLLDEGEGEAQHAA